jgi:hypothetical protein
MNRKLDPLSVEAWIAVGVFTLACAVVLAVALLGGCQVPLR